MNSRRVADKTLLPAEVRFLRLQGWTHASFRAARAELLRECKSRMGDRAVDRARLLVDVAVLSGVGLPKVRRYLDEGRASSATRRLIGAVLDGTGRGDLLPGDRR